VSIAGFDFSSNSRENENVGKILVSQLTTHDFNHLSRREGRIDKKNSSALHTAEAAREFSIDFPQLNTEARDHSLKLFQELRVFHQPGMNVLHLADKICQLPWVSLWGVHPTPDSPLQFD